LDQVDQQSRRTETRIQRRNRASIKQAALKVFARFGYEGTTLDQIADECDVSKQNFYYYFSGKEEIYRTLLDDLLVSWLTPLRKLDPNGDPLEEILRYTRAKIEMTKSFPEESRLFANEIIRGAPKIRWYLETELKDLVDDKAFAIQRWVDDGSIAEIDPHHLIFTIWAITQHYSDFETQISILLPNQDSPISGADLHVETVIRRILEKAF